MSSAASPLGRKECVVPTIQCCVKINTAIEKFFQRLGWFVADWPIITLIVNVLILIGLCFGLIAFRLETNIFDLWAPTDSPVWDENEFIDEYWADVQYGLVIFASYAKEGYDTNILEEKYLQEWYELHLDIHTNLPKINYTYTDDDGNEKIITFGYFMEDYYDIQTLDELANLSGQATPNYASDTVPLCRNFATSPLEAQFQLPCYALSVFECFTEGGYFFPYENYLVKTLLSSIIPTNPYTSRPSFQGLTGLELGAILAPSCEAWQGTVVPSNYIYGGETRTDPNDEFSQITELNSYETIAFIDSPFGVARKIKIATSQCTYTDFYSIDCPVPTDEEKEIAEELIYDWLEEYINYFESKAEEYHNDDDKLLEIVFWTPRTAGDLLIAASEANFGLLALAYVAMIIFAALVALRPTDLFLSKTEASCTGVLLVLLAVLATMGTGAIFVKFSPNVIQVLPFIALGFGVDDMFVLLFSFRFRESLTIRDMIGEATRLAGSSIAMTSTSNFFAFMVGAFMVLPDVARFATFGMIIVVLNFFTVLFGFTAILAFTARRMASRHKDCAFLCCFAEFTKANKTKSERHNAAHAFDPFFDFMTNDYTRICGFLAFFALSGLGIYGTTMAQLGLPLADIVPDGTYASDFLALRTKFYFSYIVNLYTDADGADLRRMDWENKFTTWINLTENIYDLSDTVYTDPDVHDFWAWNMKEYLSDIYDTVFQPFEPEFNNLNNDNYTRKSPMCEDDRIEKCPGVLANYSLNSDLYNCLVFNYDILSSPDCQAYLDSLVIETNVTQIVARQIQVIIAEIDDPTEGLYVASDKNEINVYYKDEGTGMIFQDTDGSWIILDESFNAVYFGPETELDSLDPPQYGWEDSNGKLQSMTIIYWNSNYTDYYRPDNVFIDFDVDASNSFEFNYSFTGSDNDATGESNSGACYLYDAIKVAMADTTNYESVSLNSNDEALSSITCNALIESTSICGAIRDETSLSSLQCGEYIENQIADLNIELSTFGTLSSNNCSKGFTITGANSNTTLTSDELCDCTSYDDSTVTNYAYISPCAYENESQDFGNFGLTSSTTCELSTDKELSVTCNADLCNSGDSCLYDYQRYANSDEVTNCAASLLGSYLENGNPIILAFCLLDFWNDLSECCQEGLKASFIENEEFTCNQVAQRAQNGPTQQICSIRETCDSDCNELCYDDTNGNCGNTISSSCYSEWNSGNVTDLLNCLNNVNVPGQCCEQSLSPGYWDEECAIARPYYYDFETTPNQPTYDYSDCSASEITDAGCDWADDTTPELMLCLIANKTMLTQDTCCYKAVDTSEPKYILTHDCHGDALKFGYSSAWELDDAALNSLTKFVWESSDPSDATQLSYACSESLQVCRTDGTWPTTELDETVTLDCPSGYGGSMTRTCQTIQVSLTQSYIGWGEVDDSQCEKLYCPAYEDEYGQDFEETEVGYVRYYFGDFRTVSDSGLTRCISNSFAHGWTQRLCSFDETTRTAVWGDAQRACRGYYTQWDDTERVRGAYCNASTASFMETYDFSEDYTQDTARMEACESACNINTPNCFGFIYEYDTGLCNLYDMCDPIAYDDTQLTSLGYASSNDAPIWIYNTLTLDQYAATICTEAAGGEANLKSYEAWNKQGIPVPECFNTSLYVYFVNPVGGTLYRDKVVFNDLSYLYDDESYRFADLEINTSVNAFAVQGIDDDTVAVELILDIRDMLAEWKKEDIYVIPGGLVFSLFSQYVGVEESLLTNLLFVSIAVVVTGFTFLLNWWAVVIMLLCNAAMIIEVYGFVEWLGLRVNGVLVLNIVIAVGLTMEFTAHIGRAFVLTKATKLDHERGVGLPFSTDGQIRMKKMYREMFNPVTMGAITTFLGVLPISLAEFPYFRQYYFVLYVVIVLFGWLNGVIFQPIFLSLLPPEPFDEEEIGDDEEPLTQTVEQDIQEQQTNDTNQAGQTDNATDDQKSGE